MKKIPLSSGKKALVDDDDYEALIKHSWWFDGRYAVREKRYGPRKRNKKRKYYMHRVVMDCPKSMMVDHINGNKLDNRKENLMVCTQVENQQNRKRQQSNNTSGYRGVSYNNTLGYWVVQGYYDGERVWCKYFKTKEEAIENRKKFEEKYFISLTPGSSVVAV